ncbi:MAG: alpha-L-rhamnosidase N-terminal domain-containing protein [Planctomycetes bacterium]|nr:alpha-L-rhamnosidase N-terminal domain-containing protein [Planctomycetota bacterium]
MGGLSTTHARLPGYRDGHHEQPRTEFSLPARPLRARAYVSGLGCYELWLNSRKVRDHVLDPA